jgi:hypothetical protein
VSAHDNVTPAFPCEWDYINTNRANANGMTLRDYFAAKALQGCLANPGCDYTPMTASAQAQAVADAYGLADAMLKKRDK